MNYRIITPIVVVGLALAAGACDRAPDARTVDNAPANAPAAQGRSADVAAEMVVYKSPTCGCCDLWVDHARDHGFAVETVDLVEYDAIVENKREHGVPMDLGSCHTALVDGYLVEGHVPADVIHRLLEERPEIRGIAVPGMPIGSPGMEGPNPRPYQVIAIGLDGSRSVYETVVPRR